MGSYYSRLFYCLIDNFSGGLAAPAAFLLHRLASVVLIAPWHRRRVDPAWGEATLVLGPPVLSTVSTDPY